MTDTTRAVAIGLLVVLALGFAAATLDSTVSPGPGGFEGASGGDGGLLPPPADSDPGEPITIPYLADLLPALVIVAGIVAVVAAIRRWRFSLASLTVAVVVAVVLYLLADPGIVIVPDGGSPSPSGNGSFLGGGGEGAGSVPTGTTTSILLFLVLGGVVLAGLIVAFTRGEDERTPSDEGRTGDDGSRGTAAALGSMAGRAADRIEAESGVDNEVYRTWREMTDLLDVDEPDTTTAGEFAAAATDAGLGEDDVAELTRLFETVRYGDAPASSEREQRALDVFRRIEDRYGEGES